MVVLIWYLFAIDISFSLSNLSCTRYQTLGLRIFPFFVFFGGIAVLKEESRTWTKTNLKLSRCSWASLCWSRCHVYMNHFCFFFLVFFQLSYHLFLIRFELFIPSYLYLICSIISPVVVYCSPILKTENNICFVVVYLQGTESIERSSPTLTKYWQQPADTCVHFQHNYKIGGKIDYTITFTSIKLYCYTGNTTTIRAMFSVMLKACIRCEKKVFLRFANIMYWWWWTGAGIQWHAFGVHLFTQSLIRSRWQQLLRAYTKIRVGAHKSGFIDFESELSEYITIIANLWKFWILRNPDLFCVDPDMCINPKHLRSPVISIHFYRMDDAT